MGRLAKLLIAFVWVHSRSGHLHLRPGGDRRGRQRRVGAVIPGVTVEAASPALIEKVRTVVTDGSRPVPRRSSCDPARTP